MSRDLTDKERIAITETEIGQLKAIQAQTCQAIQTIAKHLRRVEIILAGAFGGYVGIEKLPELLPVLMGMVR